jgi:peroxin-7
MLSFHTQGYAGYSVAYSPFFDSKIACATAANFGLAGNGRLYVLDIGGDGVVRAQAHFDTQDGLFGLAWSETHENHIAASCGDGSIRLFDITSDRPFPLQLFHEHSREVYSINWNMVDKNLFCSASWDGTIKVWSPGSSAGSVLTLSSLRDTNLHKSSNVSPSGPQVPIVKASDPLDPANADRSHCVYAAKFSPHFPTQIASAHSDSGIRLWDTRQGPQASPPVSIVDAHSGHECLTLDWNKYNNTIIASGGVDKCIKIWDTRNPRSPVNTIIGHELAVRSVSWSPHLGDILLSTSYDTTARVWQDTRLSTVPYNPRVEPIKGLRHIFNQHSEFVIDCDWSLWGQVGWVATVGWDEKLYIWNSS